MRTHQLLALHAHALLPLLLKTLLRAFQSLCLHLLCRSGLTPCRVPEECPAEVQQTILQCLRLDPAERPTCVEVRCVDMPQGWHAEAVVWHCSSKSLCLLIVGSCAYGRHSCT